MNYASARLDKQQKTFRMQICGRFTNRARQLYSRLQQQQQQQTTVNSNSDCSNNKLYFFWLAYYIRACRYCNENEWLDDLKDKQQQQQQQQKERLVVVVVRFVVVAAAAAAAETAFCVAHIHYEQPLSLPLLAPLSTAFQHLTILAAIASRSYQWPFAHHRPQECREGGGMWEWGE